MAASYPTDLADFACQWLNDNEVVEIDQDVLSDLIEVLYFTSLQKEEGESVKCTFTYLDPDTDETDPGGDGRPDRWKFTKLGEPLELTTRNVVKFAKALDPLFATATVFPGEDGKLYIWGITDQELPFHRYMARENEEAEPDHPGSFHVTIQGVGSIAVYCGYSLIASLIHDRLVTAYDSVLTSGPFVLRLNEFADAIRDDAFFTRGIAELTSDPNVHREWLTEYHGFAQYFYANIIARTLLRMQRYGHGGALIISPEPKLEELSIKYRLAYTRPEMTIERNARALALKRYTEISLWNSLGGSSIDPDLATLSKAYSELFREVSNEIEGVVALIASLTRVDGAVLLDSRLNVVGYGVEIRTNEANIPGGLQVHKATDAMNRERHLIDHEHFGTRHRSMMRYCTSDKAGVGLVVSQDGDVRAFATFEDMLIMWENVRVQFNRPKPLEAM